MAKIGFVFLMISFILPIVWYRVVGDRHQYFMALCMYFFAILGVAMLAIYTQ